MLFKQVHLYGIKEGNISLAFRKWKKKKVKKGSIIKTSIGQVEILEISELKKEELKEEDAAKAGAMNLQELLKILELRKEGKIFKIEVKYFAPDPRLQLRQETNLSHEEVQLIRKKLERLDHNSKQGAWTFRILKAISEHPKLKAKLLAESTGDPKDWLKLNVRKLNNSGLTISHAEGYTISPRGQVILDSLS